jgi:hypothetical protein
MRNKSDGKKDYVPSRGESIMAAKSPRASGLDAMITGEVSNAQSHVPTRGASHSAQEKSSKDGLKKMAPKIMHTETQKRPAPTKAAGKSTNKGA